MTLVYFYMVSGVLTYGTVALGPPPAEDLPDSITRRRMMFPHWRM